MASKDIRESGMKNPSISQLHHLQQCQFNHSPLVSDGAELEASTPRGHGMSTTAVLAEGVEWVPFAPQDPTSLRTWLIKKNPDSYHTKSYTTPGCSNQRCDLSVINVMLDQRYFTVAECPSWYVKRFIFPILPAACPTRIEKTSHQFRWSLIPIASCSFAPAISYGKLNMNIIPNGQCSSLSTWKLVVSKQNFECQERNVLDTMPNQDPKKLRKTHLSLGFAPFPGVVTTRIVTCLVWGFLQTFLCHHSSVVSNWPLRDVASPSGSSSCSPSGSSSASSCCWFRISRKSSVHPKLFRSCKPDTFRNLT